MTRDLNILVCFRVVPDLDMMPADGWETDGRPRVDTSYVRNMLNPYDESALELALRLRDGFARLGSPGRVVLTALTMGGAEAEGFLKTLAALRFDRVVRIDPGDGEVVPETVAPAVAAFVAGNPQDVVLTGSQSGLADGGKTPYYLAELLGWRCRAQVCDLAAEAGAGIRVVRRVDAGVATATVTAPCVLAVGDAPGVYLRLPTLRDRVTHGKRDIEILPLAALAREGAVATLAAPELVSLARVDSRRAGIVIGGETAADKARILYEEYLKPRMEELGR